MASRKAGRIQAVTRTTRVMAKPITHSGIRRVTRVRAMGESDGEGLCRVPSVAS